MKTSNAVRFFGSQAALARALGIKPPSVCGWGEVVPRGRAYELLALTDGAIPLEAGDYEKPVEASE